LFSASFDGLLFKLLPGHVALESAGIYLLMYLSCLVSIQFSRGPHSIRIEWGQGACTLGPIHNCASSCLMARGVCYDVLGLAVYA
ncbi:hypothetical protein KUC89_30840, partial [Pseudomonas aeruginosa]